MVVDDPDAAAALVESGARVVLVVGQATASPEPPAGPGRIATFVGDPADPKVMAAAQEMDRELFGVSD